MDWHGPSGSILWSLKNLVNWFWAVSIDFTLPNTYSGFITITALYVYGKFLSHTWLDNLFKPSIFLLVEVKMTWPPKHFLKNKFAAVRGVCMNIQCRDSPKIAHPYWLVTVMIQVFQRFNWNTTLSCIFVKVYVRNYEWMLLRRENCLKL